MISESFLSMIFSLIAISKKKLKPTHTLARELPVYKEDIVEFFYFVNIITVIIVTTIITINMYNNN